jgi:hypothetical protein
MQYCFAVTAPNSIPTTRNVLCRNVIIVGRTVKMCYPKHFGPAPSGLWTSLSRTKKSGNKIGSKDYGLCPALNGIQAFGLANIFFSFSKKKKFLIFESPNGTNLCEDPNLWMKLISLPNSVMQTIKWIYPKNTQKHI